MYLHNMEQARVNAHGKVQWVETCFCPTPLEEERPYWEKHFELIKVQDAHLRKNCRDENGSEPWACCDCDCTRKLEDKLAERGHCWLATLRDVPGAKPGSPCSG